MRIVLALGTMAFLAACGGAKQDEVVYVDEPAPITTDAPTTKY
ncbi:hypothetical protein [Gemmobacter denitrificans]|uniref:Lipoprotein n=1 Tax=Gemmobacter denitrificans TaxID=3123040 RepID=A0ABU8BQT7_9RHOB